MRSSPPQLLLPLACRLFPPDAEVAAGASGAVEAAGAEAFGVEPGLLGNSPMRDSAFCPGIPVCRSDVASWTLTHM